MQPLPTPEELLATAAREDKDSTWVMNSQKLLSAMAGASLVVLGQGSSEFDTCKADGRFISNSYLLVLAQAAEVFGENGEIVTSIGLGKLLKKIFGDTLQRISFRKFQGSFFPIVFANVF